MSKVFQGRTSLPRTRRHPVARSLAMALGLAAPHAAWAACGPNPIAINSDQTLGATNVAACDYYDWTAGNVTVTGAVSGAVTDPPPYSLLSKTGMTAATLVIEATGSVVNSDDAAVTVGNSTGVASALTALTNGGVVQTTSPMGWNAIFIWNNGKSPIPSIRPPMVGADKILNPSTFIDHDTRSAMLAGVIEGSYLPFIRMGNQNRFGSDIEDKKLARFCDIGRNSCVEPSSRPDVIPFLVKDLWRKVTISSYFFFAARSMCIFLRLFSFPKYVGHNAS